MRHPSLPVTRMWYDRFPHGADLVTRDHEVPSDDRQTSLAKLMPPVLRPPVRIRFPLKDSTMSPSRAFQPPLLSLFQSCVAFLGSEAAGTTSSSSRPNATKVLVACIFLAVEF